MEHENDTTVRIDLDDPATWPPGTMVVYDNKKELENNGLSLIFRETDVGLVVENNGQLVKCCIWWLKMNKVIPCYKVDHTGRRGTGLNGSNLLVLTIDDLRVQVNVEVIQ